MSAVIYRLVNYIYYKKIDPRLDIAAEKIGQEVEEGVKRAIEEYLPELQDRVKKGIVDGVTDMPSHANRLTSEMLKSSADTINVMGSLLNPRRKG